MLLRSGRTKNKMANVRQIEPEQENLDLEEVRGLPDPEVNFVGLPAVQSVTQGSTGAIPKITNRSAGRGRGLRKTNLETSQNRKTAPNTPNQSFLWDGIDLPSPDTPKLTNPQPNNETFPMDSFLENNNRFLAEANELLRHCDEQVIREREKFIRELENKNKGANRTAKPTAHSSFQKENMERRDKIVNKQSTKLRNIRKNVHLNSDTDDSEPREFEGDSNENRTRRETTQNGPARRSRANQDNQTQCGHYHVF